MALLNLAAQTSVRADEEAESCMHLDLSGKPVTELPQLSSITRLDVSGCDLEQLPGGLSALLHLRWINLANNRLSALPGGLAACRRLTQILAPNNRICGRNHKPPSWTLPIDTVKKTVESGADSIYTEEELQDRINDNYLYPLTQDDELDLSHFGELERLDLSSNLLAEFPRGLSASSSVTFLNLANNKIRTMPASLACAGILRHLILDDNSMDQLTDLPDWFSRLRRCSILSIAGCYLGDLLAELGCDYGQGCRRILKLDMRDTRLTTYPVSLTGLLDLEVLLLSHQPGNAATKKRDVNHNWLWHLPPSFANLRGLEHLEASYVGLRDLPDIFGSLSRLRHLDLSNNQLGWLPSSLVSLKCLEFMDLSKNTFYMLPSGFEGLSSLRHLLVSFNQLVALPPGLFKLKQLQTLDLYSNQIHTLEQELPESLARLDLASNPLSDQDLIAVCGSAFMARYAAMQGALRAWRPGPSRKEMSEQEVHQHKEREIDHEEVVDSGRVVRYARYLGDEERDGEDEYDDGEDEDDDGEDEDVVLEDMAEADYLFQKCEEDENWDGIKAPESCELMRAASPPPTVTESWKDTSLFCPAKDHPQPINEAVARVWTAELEVRRRGPVGRPPAQALVFAPNQFEDMDE